MFDVYTDVAAHVKWINDTILSMGGMQSCGYTLEKILSEDEDGDYAVDNEDDANQANSQSPYSHHLYSLTTKYAKTIKTISKILPQKRKRKTVRNQLLSRQALHINQNAD